MSSDGSVKLSGEHILRAKCQKSVAVKLTERLDELATTNCQKSAELAKLASTASVRLCEVYSHLLLRERGTRYRSRTLGTLGCWAIEFDRGSYTNSCFGAS